MTASHMATALTPVVAGRRRVICCHRGQLTGDYPSGSIEAVAECVAARVPRLEIDVRFLPDDTMLIFHGSTLDQETTGSGKVDELDRPHAEALRYRSDERVRVAFLEDVVETLRGSDTLLQVDLKLMRVISAARAEILAATLFPILSHTLIGSQAHWNLRPLAERGFRVALDPLMQLYYAPERDPDRWPSRVGVHGFWDDAALAHNRHVGACDYLDARIDDLAGLLPQATEFMVDIPTVRHMAGLGYPLGEELARRGIGLSTWTLRDLGPEATSEVLAAVFDAGVECVIADDAAVVGQYAAGLAGARS